MSELLSDKILTNMTTHILSSMKLSAECHIVDGYLNPYDFLNNAISKSESYWIPTIQKAATDTDIYKFHLLPLRTDENATVGFKITATVEKYTEGVLAYSDRELQSYTFPDDTLKTFYTAIATLVQYYIKNKSWLEAEVGTSTVNVPIFHADRFKTVDSEGNETPISTQVDVETYQEEQSGEAAKKKYGDPIVVMRPSTQTIQGGTDTFTHNDSITIGLPTGAYTATVVAVPGDGSAMFAFDALYSEKTLMITAGGIAGGYEASNLRSFLQGLFDQFPDDIKKKCVAFSNGDYLSIPTTAQLFGLTPDNAATNGQLEYFKDRRHRIANLDGDWYPYWCQDTSINNTFIVCSKGGDFDYANSNNEDVGIRILFKLKLDSNKKLDV